MQKRYVPIVGLVASALAGCGAVPNQAGGMQGAASSAGLSQEEASAILSDISSRFAARQYPNPWNGNSVLCSHYFTFTAPELVDTAISGETGKVKVRSSVSFIGDDGFNVAGVCFGLPAGGVWKPGQTATWSEEFQLEHWQSGWRIAERQNPFG